MIKGEYIFYYCPQSNDAVAGFVSRFAKKHGYRVVSSLKSMREAEKGFVSHNDAGPIEFLNLLKDATIVMGFSLHMVIFSLIMKKPFFAISTTEGARIKDLLDEVGLASRFVLADSDPSLLNNAPIDWESVDIKISNIKQVGIDFLKEALA